MPNDPESVIPDEEVIDLGVYRYGPSSATDAERESNLAAMRAALDERERKLAQEKPRAEP